MKGTGSGSHHQKQVEVLIGRTKGIAISKAFTELSFNSFESLHF